MRKRASKSATLKPLYQGTRMMIFPSTEVGEQETKSLAALAVESLSQKMPLPIRATSSMWLFFNKRVACNQSLMAALEGECPMTLPYTEVWAKSLAACFTRDDCCSVKTTR